MSPPEEKPSADLEGTLPGPGAQPAAEADHGPAADGPQAPAPQDKGPELGLDLLFDGGAEKVNIPTAEQAKATGGLGMRIASGSILASFCVTCMVVGGWAHILLVTAIALLCARELCRLFILKGFAPATTLIAASVLVLDIIVGAAGPTYAAPTLAIGAVVIVGWLLVRSKPRATIADLATSWMALMYTGFLPSFLILNRNLPDPFGLQITVMMYTSIVATDIFAYFGGRAFGRTKLLEHVSPKKTLEGSLVGTFSALLVGTFQAWLYGIPLFHGAAIGLISSVMGQIGDLMESLLKRDAGAKDSGTLLPGHGGMLDRFDSFLLTGAVIYYYLRWMYHPWIP